MKKLSIAMGVLLAFGGVNAMAANSTGHNGKVESAKVQFTSSKKAILVNEKQPQFSITLQSNPTTGFSWFLSKYNGKLIQIVSHKYIAPSSKLMGAPGHEVWTFRVTKEGFVVPRTMKIEMVYA